MAGILSLLFSCGLILLVRLLITPPDDLGRNTSIDNERDDYFAITDTYEKMMRERKMSEAIEKAQSLKDEQEVYF